MPPTQTADSLHQEAIRRAQKVGISPELMELALRAQRGDRPYVVELEDNGHTSFYRITIEGPSRILYINTGHPFFTEMYMGEGSTQAFRDGLEVFLWCLGLAELEASEADQVTYAQERHRWSQELAIALPLLTQIWGE
jgi:hypothetical protein